jgi:hypothetical protein
LDYTRRPPPVLAMGALCLSGPLSPALTGQVHERHVSDACGESRLSLSSAALYVPVEHSPVPRMGDQLNSYRGDVDSDHETGPSFEWNDGPATL